MKLVRTVKACGGLRALALGVCCPGGNQQLNSVKMRISRGVSTAHQERAPAWIWAWWEAVEDKGCPPARSKCWGSIIQESVPWPCTSLPVLLLPLPISNRLCLPAGPASARKQMVSHTLAEVC